MPLRDCLPSVRRAAAIVAGVGYLVRSAPVLAQDGPAPTVRAVLDYSAPMACPPERELRDVVASRLGYDPFSETPAGASGLRLRVTLVREGGDFTSTLDLRDASGKVIWARPPLTLTS